MGMLATSQCHPRKIGDVLQRAFSVRASFDYLTTSLGILKHIHFCGGLATGLPLRQSIVDTLAFLESLSGFLPFKAWEPRSLTLP